MSACADTNDDFCRNIREHTLGFIFLGTPHKGARLTTVGKIISLLGYWKGSSASLLEITEPKSAVNRQLHDSFMKYLGGNCGAGNTVCVFEAVKESLFGIPIMHVSGCPLKSDEQRLTHSVLQVVEEDSAVIDGSRKIGFETKHREIQRFLSRDDENYEDILLAIRNWVEDGRKKTQVQQGQSY